MATANLRAVRDASGGAGCWGPKPGRDAIRLWSLAAPSIAASIAEEREDLERQAQQVGLRLDALSEDLQRHKDSLVLERLGSEHAHSLLAQSVCPTCHQHLDDGADVSAHAMTIAESVGFIEQQAATFRHVQEDLERVINAIRSREQSISHEVHDYRVKIRAAKDTLSASNQSPSIVDIANRLATERRIGELEEISVAMGGLGGRRLA